MTSLIVYIKGTHDAKRTVHMRALFFSAAGEADTYFCPMSQVADVLSSTLVKPLRNPSSVGVRACLHECLNIALLAQRWSNHCRQRMATLVEETAEAQLVRQRREMRRDGGTPTGLGTLPARGF